MIIDIDLESDKLSTNIYSHNDILFNCIKVDSIKNKQAYTCHSS